MTVDTTPAVPAPMEDQAPRSPSASRPSVSTASSNRVRPGLDACPCERQVLPEARRGHVDHGERPPDSFAPEPRAEVPSLHDVQLSSYVAVSLCPSARGSSMLFVSRRASRSSIVVAEYAADAKRADVRRRLDNRADVDHVADDMFAIVTASIRRSRRHAHPGGPDDSGSLRVPSSPRYSGTAASEALDVARILLCAAVSPLASDACVLHSEPRRRCDDGGRTHLTRSRKCLSRGADTRTRERERESRRRRTTNSLPEENSSMEL